MKKEIPFGHHLMPADHLYAMVNQQAQLSKNVRLHSGITVERLKLCSVFLRLVALNFVKELGTVTRHPSTLVAARE